MQRREFFSSLIASGATVTNDLGGKPLKHRKRDKASNEIYYRGPMEIPAHIAEMVRESPDLHRLRGGGRKVAMRYADHTGTWLFRSRIPEHRQMVGEIVRTPEGSTRVHCWSVATPSPTIRLVSELLARREAEMPAIPTPKPGWKLNSQSPPPPSAPRVEEAAAAQPELQTPIFDQETQLSYFDPSSLDALNAQPPEDAA